MISWEGWESRLVCGLIIVMVICSFAGDDAALIRLPTPAQESTTPLLSVHSLDYFRSFLSDPFVLGKIAAVHALSGE
jgi:uncharacterized membrane protein